MKDMQDLMASSSNWMQAVKLLGDTCISGRIHSSVVSRRVKTLKILHDQLVRLLAIGAVASWTSIVVLLASAVISWD